MFAIIATLFAINEKHGEILTEGKPMLNIFNNETLLASLIVSMSLISLSVIGSEKNIIGNKQK